MRRKLFYVVCLLVFMKINACIGRNNIHPADRVEVKENLSEDGQSMDPNKDKSKSPSLRQRLVDSLSKAVKSELRLELSLGYKKFLATESRDGILKGTYDFFGLSDSFRFRLQQFDGTDGADYEHSVVGYLMAAQYGLVSSLIDHYRYMEKLKTEEAEEIEETEETIKLKHPWCVATKGKASYYIDLSDAELGYPVYKELGDNELKMSFPKLEKFIEFCANKTNMDVLCREVKAKKRKVEESEAEGGSSTSNKTIKKD